MQNIYHHERIIFCLALCEIYYIDERVGADYLEAQQ
jgi:hypothetical protein